MFCFHNPIYFNTIKFASRTSLCSRFIASSIYCPFLLAQQQHLLWRAAQDVYCLFTRLYHLRAIGFKALSSICLIPINAIGLGLSPRNHLLVNVELTRLHLLPFSSLPSNIFAVHLRLALTFGYCSGSGSSVAKLDNEREYAAGRLPRCQSSLQVAVSRRSDNHILQDMYCSRYFADL